MGRASAAGQSAGMGRGLLASKLRAGAAGRGTLAFRRRWRLRLSRRPRRFCCRRGVRGQAACGKSQGVRRCALASPWIPHRAGPRRIVQDRARRIGRRRRQGYAWRIAAAGRLPLVRPAGNSDAQRRHREAAIAIQMPALCFQFLDRFRPRCARRRNDGASFPPECPSLAPLTLPSPIAGENGRIERNN